MNTEILDHFLREVHDARLRAVELRDVYNDPTLLDRSELLTKIFNELFDTLEELQVADAELRAQQEELFERQNEILRQRQYYQELFDFAPDAYVVTDSLGMIVEANRAAALLFNRRQEVLIGKPLSVFVVVNRRSEFRDNLGKLRIIREPVLWETDAQPTRLPPVKVSISAKAVAQPYGSGQRFCWLLRKTDDELRQRALQAQEDETRRVQWMATISHELRTPLSSIKGFVSSLLAKDVDFDADTRREFLEIVDTETDKITDLVSQLLDFSRVQSGTLRLSLQAQSLSDVMAVARTGLKLLAEEHTLQVDVPDNLPFIMADSQRISQVLLNLVDNAVKYSPPRTTITIRAHRVEEMVQIDVSDQGEGIPPEDRERIFQAYHQTARQSQKKGTGLGLAICKGIVEAHGGMIWAMEQTAPGATISFTLPMAEGLED